MTVITPESAGWAYSGLRVWDLAPGEDRTLDTGDDELLVLPLSGSCSVTVDGETFRVAGRESVFSRVSDFVYAPRDARVTVTSAGGGRFALPSARCENRLSARYGPAEDVPVELRGAGQAGRQVNNFCTPEAFPYADRLIACEVLTPAGNWSSYPPHKHDEERPGECVLEEIYYFEIGDGPNGPGMGYQRVYGTTDVLKEVRSGDTVLIPHGWHGPSMAAPGYDMYYLNVMAGPAPERAWLICDDPAHAWVRSTWAGQPMDARLPMTSAEGVEGRR
ncbi:5-deoxy-glucuronate isomerase [Thermomonospora umbrina]|uniref:5-deoxyglucuronate isomerase n=1 Tax=Thermomonospora umbrina TaxID=111806 RepID=A0A3D9SGS8_9ACTN|nr:5-deoxy-glucuronate isomerase [Thermomonospora umbrina]REE95109.1 5-deoxyglucuronate isomerase [Thermomonospora umbrina]